MIKEIFQDAFDIVVINRIKRSDIETGKAIKVTK